MNFLQLCQETRSRAGISGTGPTVVTGNQGVVGRIVNYVRDALVHIESDPGAIWKWMHREDGQAETVVNSNDVGLTDVRSIINETMTFYDMAKGVSDRRELPYIEYRQIRSLIRSVIQSPGEPQLYAFAPDSNIRIYPAADASYKLEFEYIRQPQVLIDNGDVPEMPEHFHMAIVNRALMIFGNNESAPEVFQSAVIEYTAVRNAMLESEQLKREDYRVIIPQ